MKTLIYLLFALLIMPIEVNAQWYNKPASGFAKFFLDSDNWWTPKAENALLFGGIFNAIADDIQHTKFTNQKLYIGSDKNWHVIKWGSNTFMLYSAALFTYDIFVKNYSYKQAGKRLLRSSLMHYLTFRMVYRINKGGFNAYNDPIYNQNAIPLFSFSGDFPYIKDKFISTGRITQPLVDLATILMIWKLR